MYDQPTLTATCEGKKPLVPSHSMKMVQFFPQLLASLSIAVTRIAYAQGDLNSLDTAELTGLDMGDISVQEAIDNLVTVLQFTVIPVATAIFAVGALLYVLGADKEETKNKGKDFMIGSLIGVAIVLGARAILNLTLYFIYG